MVYDDGALYHRRQRHIPIWSEDRLVGRFHGNETLCRSCHPHCGDGNCDGFTELDVSECNVGQSCDRCGTALPGSEAQVS